MLKQNLYDINLYAQKSLDAMERGIDVVPDWIHHKLGTARAYMKDVGHFIRYRMREGRKYASTPKHEVCRNALMNISEYARAISQAIEKGALLPEWAQHKISVVSEYMDCIGHNLEHRTQGRAYTGPAWQTQHFQKTFSGPRVYSQVIVTNDRGVAAVGGVRWVPPPAQPGMEYPTAARSAHQHGLGPVPPYLQYRQVSEGRQYGVPGRALGAPGWAGAAGVAQAPHPGGCIRGGRNKKGLKRGPPHAYGSLGYASMGDGSMDLATGGERMRRYACPSCGGDAEIISERQYAAIPELKDPFAKCVTVIGFDGKPKTICPGQKIKTKEDSDLKDPFKSKKSAGMSARRRGKKRPKFRRIMGRKSRRAYSMTWRGYAFACEVCGQDGCGGCSSGRNYAYTCAVCGEEGCHGCDRSYASVGSYIGTSLGKTVRKKKGH